MPSASLALYVAPFSLRSTIRAASARAIGAEKPSSIGRTGTHGACAFTRVQRSEAENARRTWNASDWSWLVAMPPVVATPLPQTRRAATPFGSVRRHWTTAAGSGAALGSLIRSTIAAGGPPASDLKIRR
ncbi:MAG TPA: hypothetical protein VML91_10325 [Burkholderiales bacterium]|nr:hypothetical protein [Burkholderiales bacterium]